MSRFFPHTAYAEDQPLSKTILTAHVLYRGFQAGATLGIGAGLVRALIAARQRGAPSAAATLKPSPQLLQTTLRSTGVGALVGTAAMAVALPMRMRGREPIEWQDRSWRLLENEGQVQVDDFSLVGALVGVGAAAQRGQIGPPARWQGVVGGAGLGSMVGVVGYLVWKYGLPKQKGEM